MKRLLIAAALAALCPSPASADTLSVLTANTLTLTDASGGVTTVLLNADNSLRQIDPAGVTASGFWSADNDRLCMTARGKAQICFSLPADKQVGDTFDLTGQTGRVAWTAAIAGGRADWSQTATEVRPAPPADAAAADAEAQ